MSATGRERVAEAIERMLRHLAAVQTELVELRGGIRIKNENVAERLDTADEELDNVVSPLREALSMVRP